MEAVVKKTVVLLLVLTVGSVFLFDGGNNQAQSSSTTTGKTNIRFVWWGSDDRHKNTLAAISLFEKAYPDIAVTPEYMGSDSYWDKLAVQTAGGNAPDVQQFGGNYPDYVAKDALLELEKYRGNLLNLADFDEAILEDASMNGHLYGISLGTNMLCLIYNKSMLERAGAPLPPETWSYAQMRQYMASIQSRLPAGVWPITDLSFNQTFYNYMMRQNKTATHIGDNKTQSTATSALPWLDLWEDYRKNKLCPDIETTATYADSNVDNSAIVAGKVAFGFIWSNQVIGYQNAMKDEIGVQTLPDLEKNAMQLRPSQYICVNKKSANPEAALKFVNFFVNDLEVGKILGSDRGVSSSSAVRAAITPLASPTEQKVYNYYAIATKHLMTAYPNTPNTQEWDNTYKLINQRLAFGQINATQAAREIYDLTIRLLAK
jgi:multiple sugar transport system substrate-binding protein